MMIRFGTGGWRDIIGENFTFDNVRRFSQGVANHIIESGKEKQGVVIGYDNRFMAEDFAKASSAVFAANSIPVLLLTPSVPTPLVNFVTIEEKTAAGLTFTASHNPYIYNGIKYVREHGLPATEEVTTELQESINKIPTSHIKTMEYDLGEREGLIKRLDYHDEFITFIESQVNMDKLKEAKLKVLYDPMFGTGVNAISTLLVDARCQVRTIHNSMDPLFGGRVPAPTEETLWRVVSMMKEKPGDYDIGIATDGDGDRIAVIDENGEYVHPNEIITLLYYYMLKYRKQKGAVVRNVSTTHLLDRVAEDFGFECIEKPVGFKHIAEGMTQTDAIIGGESSGGITIKGHLLEKDAILSAGLLLEMLAVTGKTLGQIRSEVKDRYGIRHYKEDNYAYSSGRKEDLKELVNRLDPEFIYEAPVTKTNRMDGVKWEWEDGTWCGVRFSGTEPLLRIIVESPEEEIQASVLANLRQKIDAALSVSKNTKSV
ncbi:phosphoglucomutase/phosphomannomutase family protein [Alteribacter keqinensis]|uniref:Phosphoglucomutase n=1 Tax=Alteribacter keqinensis TaxID=2483800 RepID=A0A3M7TQM1_9BACI|nr:phosphoglucomutase/phosphomannomutase family protein [Alteribacter keqinensis]RNA67721.1 phosphoglucomutase/phosphomannomutase family protein [Alteribacter keqinensis]